MIETRPLMRIVPARRQRIIDSLVYQYDLQGDALERLTYSRGDMKEWFMSTIDDAGNRTATASLVGQSELRYPQYDEP